MNDGLTSWRELINDAFVGGDTWNDVIANTLTEEELDVRFDNGWGRTEGKPFTMWTTRRIYFPVQYDGSEWCASVSRDPDGQATNHVGGG